LGGGAQHNYPKSSQGNFGTKRISTKKKWCQVETVSVLNRERSENKGGERRPGGARESGIPGKTKVNGH